MKATIILISLFFLLHSGLSQEIRKNQIGITYSTLGNNDVFRFQELEGGGSYEGDKFFTIGVNYLQSLNEWLFIETGLEYADHHIYSIPNSPPNVDILPSKNRVKLVNIPLTLRAHFLNYLFINGGAILDLDVSKTNGIDSQTGIGGVIGLGFQYDFKSGAALYMNPYLKAHSLIPFSSENYHQHLMESGIRFGLSYNLSKK